MWSYNFIHVLNAEENIYFVLKIKTDSLKLALMLQLKMYIFNIVDMAEEREGANNT